MSEVITGAICEKNRMYITGDITMQHTVLYWSLRLAACVMMNCLQYVIISIMSTSSNHHALLHAKQAVYNDLQE